MAQQDARLCGRRTADGGAGCRPGVAQVSEPAAESFPATCAVLAGARACQGHLGIQQLSSHAALRAREAGQPEGASPRASALPHAKSPGRQVGFPGRGAPGLAL